MVTYHMGLIRRGKSWTPDVNEETINLQNEHQDYIQNMFEESVLKIAGPFLDDGDLRGVFLLRTESLEEAQEWAAGDPAVKSGRLIVDIHPWLVPVGVVS